MGVLVNDLQADFSRTRMTSESAPDCILQSSTAFIANSKTKRGRRLRGSSPIRTQLNLARTVDARYAGQNHELTVEVPAGPFDGAALAAVKSNFHAAHREMFGYDSPEKPIELVTFRLRARMAVARADFAGTQTSARSGALAPAATRKVYFDNAGGFVDCPVYERGALLPGDTFQGPAIVEQMDCTTVIPPDFGARVDDMFNLLLQFKKDRGSRHRGRRDTGRLKIVGQCLFSPPGCPVASIFKERKKMALGGWLTRNSKSSPPHLKRRRTKWRRASCARRFRRTSRSAPIARRRSATRTAARCR